MTTPIPAIVLGNGITALGVLRIFQRAGIAAFHAGSPEPLLRRSLSYRRLPVRDLQGDGETLDSWLRRLPFDRAVLMPCSDTWVTRIAARSPELRHRFPASISEPQVLRRLVDKGCFADTIREIGIPHPNSLELETRTDAIDIPAGAFEAAILKPRNSQLFHDRFGVKAFHVGDRNDVTERLASIRAAGSDAILQEFIPGPPTQHYFVDGFVDRHMIMRGLLVRQRLRMYPPDFGNSTYMVSVRPEAASQAVESMQLLLKRIGYRGIFSAEFKLDPRDGRFKILEVNARPWWYVDFTARCGVDVCTMAYHDALEQEVPSIDAYRTGRRLVFPYKDFFACKAMRRRKELTLWSWARSWLGAMQPVFRWTDPLPAVAGSLEIMSAFVRRRLAGSFASSP